MKARQVVNINGTDYAQPDVNESDSFAEAATIDRKGGGGNNGGMDQRIRALEETVVDVRERLARIEVRLNHTATGEDVARVESSLLRWFVGTAIALTGLAFAAAKLIT